MTRLLAGCKISFASQTFAASPPGEAAASPGSQICAPRTVGWDHVVVLLEEVVQHVQEPQDVLTVAKILGSPDTVDNHVPDFFAAVLYAQHGTGKAGRHDFGNALVFRDHKHHFLGQAAERNAIFPRNHSLYCLA